MSAPQSNQINRSYHLGRLDRSLHRIGTFGTAFVNPDEKLEDTWAGLLVWNIEHGAQSGIVIRCNQEPRANEWYFCHNDGTVIAEASNLVAIVQELTEILVPTLDSAAR